MALARLVLADPHTLVLDEATSLLDPRAARHLERSLAAVVDGRTVVAIAHRLHTAHDADRVAVVEEGVVSELGRTTSSSPTTVPTQRYGGRGATSPDDVSARVAHSAARWGAGQRSTRRIVTSAGRVVVEALRVTHRLLQRQHEGPLGRRGEQRGAPHRRPDRHLDAHGAEPSGRVTDGLVDLVADVLGHRDEPPGALLPPPDGGREGPGPASSRRSSLHRRARHRHRVVFGGADSGPLGRRRGTAAACAGHPQAGPGTAGCRGSTGGSTAYGSACDGRRSGLTAVGPQRHRPLGLGGDRQRRVDAEVGRHGGPVDDGDARVAPDPVVRVEHPALGRSAPIAAPPMKCAVMGVSSTSPQEPPGTARTPVSSSSRAARTLHRVVPDLDVRGVGLSVALGRREPAAAEQALPAVRAQGVVPGLHDEADDGPLAPPVGVEPHGRQVAGMPDELDERLREPRAAGAAAARARRPAGAMAFDPLPYRQFSTWVTSSGWKDDVMAAPRVRSTSLRHETVCAQQRLGVGAGEVAEPLARSAAAPPRPSSRAAAAGCPRCPRPRRRAGRSSRDLPSAAGSGPLVEDAVPRVARPAHRCPGTTPSRVTVRMGSTTTPSRSARAR